MHSHAGAWERGLLWSISLKNCYSLVAIRRQQLTINRVNYEINQSINQSINNSLKLACLVSSLGFSIAHADIDSGLFAYYSFDDCTANDSSASNLDGSVTGTPSCVNGKSGQALSFNADGDDGDYIALPTFSANAFKTGFSVCAWVKFEKGRYFERIIDFGNGPWSDNLVFYRYDNGNNLGFASLSGSKDNHFFANNAIKNGNWKFYCATLDPLTKISLVLIDGKLAASAAQIPLTNIQRVHNFIGHSNWSDQRDFMGIMDEVRIYSRALSVEDIQTLYNLAIPVSGSLNSLGSHTVSCTNNTTEESVQFPATQKTSFNCQAKGLVINPGDDVTITINGINK